MSKYRVVQDTLHNNDLTQISFPLVTAISEISKKCDCVRARIIYKTSYLDLKTYELIICVECGKLINSRPC